MSWYFYKYAIAQLTNFSLTYLFVSFLPADGFSPLPIISVIHLLSTSLVQKTIFSAPCSNGTAVSIKTAIAATFSRWFYPHLTFFYSLQHYKLFLDYVRYSNLCFHSPSTKNSSEQFDNQHHGTTLFPESLFIALANCNWFIIYLYNILSIYNIFHYFHGFQTLSWQTDKAVDGCKFSYSISTIAYALCNLFSNIIYYRINIMPIADRYTFKYINDFRWNYALL